MKQLKDQGHFHTPLCVIDLLFTKQRPLLLFYVSIEATSAACGTFAAQLRGVKWPHDRTYSIITAYCDRGHG